MVNAEVIPKTDAKIAILRRLNLKPAIPDQMRSTAAIKMADPKNNMTAEMMPKTNKASSPSGISMAPVLIGPKIPV